MNQKKTKVYKAFPDGDKGFTLVELLVTMGIIIVVGSIVASILLIALRVSTKATVLSDVKQNGAYALSQISQTIRSATSLAMLPCDNPSPAVQTIVVTQIDLTKTTFDCSTDTITANGISLLDTATVQLVPSSCSLVCSQQTASDIPLIQIKFSLMGKKSGNFVEQTATIPFQTSVFLRNLQQ